MCFSNPQPTPPPAPPAPAPAPPVDAPQAPVIEDKLKNSTNANQIAAGTRRGVNSLKIAMNPGGGSGLAIPN